MGLADREYMRDRCRHRAAADTVWNDAKGRVEADRSWFAAKNRGHDHQKGRWRPAPKVRVHPRSYVLLLLSAAVPLVSLYYEGKRSGWVPDSREEVAFPQTGEVMVNRAVDPTTAIASFRVVAADANAVAQLYRLSGEHVISVFVRKNDDVTTRVPPGTYQLRIAEGQCWFGPEHFFGNSMTFETAAEAMRFTRRQGNGIDLHRRPDGSLKTRPNFRDPTF